jgi:hypothetical protein
VVVRTKPVPILERDFQQLVTDAAELYGWRWVHFRVARTAHGWRTATSGPLGKGFPDLALFRDRDGRVIYAELKTDRGQLDADQIRVFEYLGGVARRHGWLSVVVWRPEQWDEILEVLR